MIDHGHPRLSIVRQCALVSISRSSFYREPTAEREQTLRLMRLDARDFAPVARNDWLEHVLPVVGAVNVTGAKGTAFQITELVEHEQRVIAGAGIMAIPDAVLLVAMGRAHARIHVRCHGAACDRAQDRSTGPTSRQEQKGSRVPRAIALRSAPSGSPKPHSPEPPCRRQSSASPGHGAVCRRR